MVASSRPAAFEPVSLRAAFNAAEVDRRRLDAAALGGADGRLPVDGVPFVPEGGNARGQDGGSICLFFARIVGNDRTHYRVWTGRRTGRRDVFVTAAPFSPNTRWAFAKSFTLMTARTPGLAAPGRN